MDHGEMCFGRLEWANCTSAHRCCCSPLARSLSQSEVWNCSAPCDVGAEGSGSPKCHQGSPNEKMLRNMPGAKSIYRSPPNSGMRICYILVTVLEKRETLSGKGTTKKKKESSSGAEDRSVKSRFEPRLPRNGARGGHSASGSACYSAAMPLAPFQRWRSKASQPLCCALL